MKRINYKRYPGLHIYLLVIIITSGSCKKLIEIPDNPPSQLPASAVFTDSLNVMGAIAGVYTNFKVASSLAFLSGNIPLFTGLSGDELQSKITQPYIQQLYNNAQVSNSTSPSSLWDDAYKSIYVVNACIEGIGAGSGISASLKQQLLGEMKVVRALYYFNLVNIFGGVPMVLSTDYHTTQSLPRASAEQVYAQISKDLAEAKSALNPDYPSFGRARPNRYTALALEAKVNLYRQQWKDAIADATDVINSGVYALEPDVNNVFLDGSTEAIWQLPADGAYNQTYLAYSVVPLSTTSAPNYSLSKYLLDAFETDDQRFASWTNSYSVTVGGTPTTYYYPYKYKNNSNPAPTTEDYMVLRLADQYLIRAEARIRNGDIPGALTDLNIIRERAGLAHINGGTPAVLLNDIIHERQVEYFCEAGDRWFDLKRLAIIDDVLTKEKPSWIPSQALYPIPLSQIQNNRFLIQNPGY